MWLGGLLLIAPGTFAGAYGGGGGYDECGVDVDRGADAHAYYLDIAFAGAVPDTAVRVQGRALRIVVLQGAGGAHARCRYRFSRTFTLPMDADPERITRHDEQGRVLFVIPRRTRWP